MNNLKILSGYDIVAKGATKIDATLPELGTKEVFPNKTWLEDKQIHAAIEARKQLIEVERIDKSGVLSHAEWRDELMLAEVTQKIGSCWQYLGHNVGKILYLKPEEALFMLEINNLCLKHNDVKVSLQQAYTLLLKDNITLLKYKVYASLSRVGYRVYRHKTLEANTFQQETNKKVSVEVSKEASKSKQNLTEILDENIEQNNKSIQNSKVQNSTTMQEEYKKHSNQIKLKKACNLKKLQILKNRQLKPCNTETLHKYFTNIPELLGKNIVIVKGPVKNLLPSTINLNKTEYNVNLLNIQKKIESVRPSSTETNIYSANDEANGSHIRRLRNISNRTEYNGWIPPTNTRFATQNTHYRTSSYWRQRQFNYYNFNMLFQRPFLPCWHYFPRVQPHFWRPNFYNNNRNYYWKKTRKNNKKHHLDGILKLAARFKQLYLSGNTHEQNVYSLLKLIQSYNTRYKTKVRLNESYDIVIDDSIAETITLDDEDEGPSPKRHRPNPALEDNLNSLKRFGLRLKELELKDKCTGKHRRAFSKLLKTFNESYKEDYYLNEDYELVCRNQIDLDTSDSDLECITQETPVVSGIVSGKKLKNPFNILKRLSETQNLHPAEVVPSGSNNSGSNKKYSEVTLNTFTKGWLPGEDDFGRAEVISKDDQSNEVTDIRREEFMYDFIKMKTSKYDNWLDLKKSFFRGIQAAIVEFQNNMPTSEKMDINSIVNPEDGVDMGSVLKKLSIIKSGNSLADECNLAIDFDVYNRDVQNFRKSMRPTPHFRVVCFNELINLPTGEEIAALHAKYADEVTIIFAIVGTESISYVQINPTNLPVYVANIT